MKKALRILLIALTCITLLFGLLAAFTQTQFFRDRLRNIAISQLDSLLDAHIRIGAITGNLVEGFSIHDVSIKVRDNYFVTTERIELQYDLFQVPSKRINVKALTLVKPTVTFLRGRDSVWNFVRMVRPTPDDTAGRTPFDWPVEVGRLEIQDGTVILVDSASLAEPDHAPPDPYFVEYHHFALKNLNLITSAFFARDTKKATIDSLSFVSEYPDVKLLQCSGEAVVDHREARVKNLRIRTGRSDVRIDAALRDFDLFRGIELDRLQRCPLTTTLRAHDLDLNELKRFIPQLKFLNGIVALDIDVDGEFGEMNVKRLTLKTGNTQLFISGLVANVHIPRDLYLDVKCAESGIDYTDVLNLMPTFDLPDYRNLGNGKLSFEFLGRPLDFQAKGTIETASGSVTSDVALKIGGSDGLVYNGEAAVRQLDLAALFNNDQWTSRLNAVARIQGKGVSFDRLEGVLRLGLDSSEFMGQRVGRSTIDIDAAKRRVTSTVKVALGASYFDLAGELSVPNGSLPEYTLEGSVTSWNIQQFFLQHPYSSDLTMRLKAEGRGLSVHDLSADVSVHLDSSRYGEYRIDSAAYAGIHLDQRDPLRKELRIESSIADAQMSGAFDLAYLAKLISFESANLAVATGTKLRPLDSTMVPSSAQDRLMVLRNQLSALRESVDIEYSVQLKNLEPISIVTGARRFNGGGVMAGTLKGGYRDLALDAALILDGFYYGTADSGMLIQDGMAMVSVKNLLPFNPLDELELVFTCTASSVHLNRNEFDSLALNVAFVRDSSEYAFSSRYNHDMSIGLQGISAVVGEQAMFTLKNLEVGFKDFVWRADPGATIGFGGHSIRLRDLTMRRNGETLSLGGFLDGGETLDATITGSRLDLQNLKYALPREEVGRQPQGFEGYADFEIRAHGSLRQPAYEASIRVDDLVYRTVPFGRVRGNFNYRDELLAVHGEIDNRADTRQGKPDLVVDGTLPLDLSLAGSGGRVPDKPMDFSVYSEGVQMSLLDPLLPTFNDLKGILRADVRMVGSPKRPTFSGSMTIEKCSFLFVPNNMYYDFAARVQPEGERVKVLQATIQNMPADNRQGREGMAHVTGDFALRDFIPTDFNLSATGALLVVSKTTRRSSLAVFGDLFVEIKPQGLRFTGELDNSLLKGYVLVRNSNLTFPPTQAIVQEESPFAIPVRVVDDTSRVVAVRPRVIAARYFNADKDTAREGTQAAPSDLPTKSFIEGLMYDLNLESSGGNTEIEMIFNPATNEELVATIAGNATITQDGRHWVGSLSVDRAYYNFYGKKFEAKGTMTYSGDFVNPELDIQAQYQGTRQVDTAKTKAPEKVVVTNRITGTRSQPKLEMSMTIDEVDYSSYTRGPKSGDVQSDAVAFIMSGDFPLTRGERTDLASQVQGTLTSTLSAGATSLLTGALSDLLREQLGFLKSVELRYGQGESLRERADIRVSGTLFKGLWRYGGRILDDPLTNANLSVLYSFGDIFERPSLRNFMFELERRVDFGVLGQPNDRKEVNSARMFYRFSF